MFRRFMIVCWALFSLGVFTGAVGLWGYKTYDNKIMDLRFDSWIESGVDSAYGIKQELRQDIKELNDILARAQNTESETLKFGDDEVPRELFIQKTQAVIDRATSQLDTVSTYSETAQLFFIVAAIGGSLAFLMLLWNVIWHVGHWIWMGRESASTHTATAQM